MNFFGCTSRDGAARISPERKRTQQRPSDVARRGLNSGDECAYIEPPAREKARVLTRIRKDAITQE